MTQNMEYFRTSTLQMTDGINFDQLIGRPHLLGLFYDMPRGFHVVPVNVLTMQADGSVAGERMRNQDRWVYYRHASDVYASSEPARAFAFTLRFGQMSGGSASSGIPSSTWRNMLGNLPIGYFCDEPEAPQKLCLVPVVGLPEATRVIYVISSCYKFYERTIPELHSQMLTDGIRAERIRIVVNGCDSNTNGVFLGSPIAFSTHDAWEWSSLFEAPLRWTGEFDYAMLIHDTARILPGFRRSVESVNGFGNWDHIPVTPMARCLLGLYSFDFLKYLNPWLASIDGISKGDGILAESAGELLLRARRSLAIGPNAQWKDVCYPFGSNSPRIRRVFPGCNIHKFIHAGGNPRAL